VAGSSLCFRLVSFGATSSAFASIRVKFSFPFSQTRGTFLSIRAWEKQGERWSCPVRRNGLPKPATKLVAQQRDVSASRIVVCRQIRTLPNLAHHSQMMKSAKDYGSQISCSSRQNHMKADEGFGPKWREAKAANSAAVLACIRSAVSSHLRQASSCRACVCQSGHRISDVGLYPIEKSPSIA